MSWAGDKEQSETVELASLGFEGRRAYAAVVSRLTGRTMPTKIGRYRIQHRIGHGAFGSVYLAHDPRLDCNVAIKIVGSAGDSPNVHARARLIREAQALGRLRHSNVVQVFDVGTFDGPDGTDVYIVMELLDGPTLHDWVDEEGPSADRIIAAYASAARTLAAAHAVGIVHRDFKPSNAMFDAHGTVKVVDFGLARLRPRAAEGPTEPMHPVDPEESQELQAAWETQVGVVVGTPRYMAPEQQCGETATPLADQYAWCVSLWTALVGKAPFDGSFAELVVEKRLGVPRRPKKLPRWLYRVLARGLDPNPQRRFASMEDLLDALRDPPRGSRIAAALGVAGLGLAAALSTASASSTTAPHQSTAPQAEHACTCTYPGFGASTERPADVDDRVRG